MAQKKKSPKTALDPSFSARKPISAWNRPLQLDAKGLFGALAKGTLHGVTGQWTELGGDTVDGLAALGIDSRDASQLSWLLLRRSLLSAMMELIRESLPEIGDSKENLKEVSQRLDAALDNEEVAIDRSLFDRPRDLPLLEVVRKPFMQWLAAYGLEPPAAASTTRRLASYFVLALHTEWRKNPAAYEPIREAVDTPFTRTAEREWAWSAYAARLDRQIDEPMFGESFGLRQVYVPLRAFYVSEYKQDQLSDGISDIEKFTEANVFVHLENEIDNWIEKGDKRDSYRVLSGGPGSGKSSFLRMYAARAAQEEHLRVLFIPLHQLNVAGSLVAAVGDYLRFSELLPSNPLDPDFGVDRLLLLLDGLDELAMQGRLGADSARDFVREVLKHVDLRNQERCRLLVLFSGREPVIQANESEFRERHRVLHVLPYVIEEQRQTWGIHYQIQEEDQRPRWWAAYGKAKGVGHIDLPAELKRADLDELTAQPLLNYLIALSYGRGRLSFSAELNLNDIYRDLLEAVHDRGYEQRRSLTPVLSFDEFRRILEEIALTAWHGSGRTASVAQIAAHCEAAGLIDLLRRFEAGAKTGVTRVLTAFYFRQFGRTVSGDATFEFTHKSFREYLTAIRVVDALENIREEMDRRRQKPGVGWDEALALKHWVEVCGPAKVDWELWVFIANEIKRRGEEAAKAWQEILCGLISYMLANGMPMEFLLPRPSFHEESRQARNAEEALLAVLNACARISGRLSQIGWPEAEDKESSRTAFGTWLKKLQGQRSWSGAANSLTLSYLSQLDLAGQAVGMADLAEANLQRVDLRGGYLKGAILEGANLTGAILERANMGRAHLVRAGLVGALLAEADLTEADLRNANLSGADLTGADLTGANLKEANLRKANLRWTKLREADLRLADLRETDLTRAKLFGADLRNADLRGANLTGANLIGADLTGAILTGADLRGADLERAILENAVGLDSEYLLPQVTVDNIVTGPDHQ